MREATKKTKSVKHYLIQQLALHRLDCSRKSVIVSKDSKQQLHHHPHQKPNRHSHRSRIRVLRCHRNCHLIRNDQIIWKWRAIQHVLGWIKQQSNKLALNWCWCYFWCYSDTEQIKSTSNLGFSLLLFFWLEYHLTNHHHHLRIFPLHGPRSSHNGFQKWKTKKVPFYFLKKLKSQNQIGVKRVSF